MFVIVFFKDIITERSHVETLNDYKTRKYKRIYSLRKPLIVYL